MLAVDGWVADGSALLKDAFAGATRALAEAMQAMCEYPGPPVRDLDEIRVEPDGRRLLRSRIEPTRGVGEAAGRLPRLDRRAVPPGASRRHLMRPTPTPPACLPVAVR